MPGAAEMHVLKAEIGGNQQFESGAEAENGAIVADASLLCFIFVLVLYVGDMFYQGGFLFHVFG